MSSAMQCRCSTAARARSGLIDDCRSVARFSGGVASRLHLRRADCRSAWRNAAQRIGGEGRRAARIRHAARGLYQLLRQLDTLGCARILVEILPEAPAWTALNDRLSRAAVLEHVSVRLPLARARRQYGDRCRRSRSPSRSDGGDPAASSYGEREATQGKPLKHALVSAVSWTTD